MNSNRKVLIRRRTAPVLGTAFVFLLALAACSRTARLDLGAPLPEDRKLVRGVLPNGLSWYLRPAESPGDRVLFRLVVAAGASDETGSESGYAHFVEHMAFNGTRLYPETSLDDLFDSLDDGRELEVNAFTYPDYTVYLVEIPSDLDEVLELGLGILRQWASEQLFEPAEVEREKGVILAEMREEDTTENRIRAREERALYAGTPFEGREVLGTPDSIARTDSARLENFYRRLYVPGRMAVIVAGPVDPEETRSAVERAFVNISRDDARSARKPLVLPRELRVVRCEDERRTRTELRLLLREEAAPVRSEADLLREYRRATTEKVLANRLADLGADPAVPWAFRWAKRWPERSGERLWGIALSCPPGAEADCLRSLGRELGELSVSGAEGGEAEIEATVAMRNLPSSDPDAYESADAALFHFLYGDAVADPGSIEDLASLLFDAVLGEAVPGLGSAPGDLPSLEAGVLSVIAPGSIAVSDDALRAALREGTEEGRSGRPGSRRIPFERASAVEGLPGTELPAGGGVASRTVREDGAVELVLVNGVRALVKATGSGDGWAWAGAWSPGGLLSLPESRRISADAAPDILAAAGFPGSSPGALRALLAGSGAEWSADVAEREEYVEIDGNASELQPLFQLLASFFDPPAQTSATIAKATAARAELLRVDTGVETGFYASVDTSLGWSGVSPDPVELERLDPADIRDAWLDRFGDASDFVFLAAGDFDSAEAERLAAVYLGRLRTGNKREALPRIPAPPSPGVYVFAAPPDAARGHVEAVWSVRGIASAEAARMADLAGELEYRLFRALREDLSSTYDVLCSWEPFAGTPGAGEFRVDFEAAPGRALSLAGELTREMEAFVRCASGIVGSASAGAAYSPYADEDAYLRLLAEVRGTTVSGETPLPGGLARLAEAWLAPEAAAVFVLASGDAVGVSRDAEKRIPGHQNEKSAAE